MDEVSERPKRWPYAAVPLLWLWGALSGPAHYLGSIAPYGYDLEGSPDANIGAGLGVMWTAALGLAVESSAVERPEYWVVAPRPKHSCVCCLRTAQRRPDCCGFRRSLPVHPATVAHAFRKQHGAKGLALRDRASFLPGHGDRWADLPQFAVVGCLGTGRRHGSRTTERAVEPAAGASMEPVAGLVRARGLWTRQRRADLGCVPSRLPQQAPAGAPPLCLTSRKSPHPG